MALSNWSLPSVDANTAALLHVFLPFPVGFLVGRLIYGWINKASRQAAGFSPTVASILTTPLLAVVGYMLATNDFIHDSIRSVLRGVLAVLVLFAPMILVQSALLAIYLRGGFRRKRIFGIVLCAATVVLVIVEFLGLYLFFRNVE